MTKEVGVGIKKNQTSFVMSIVLRCTRAENTTTLSAQKALATLGSFVKKKLVCKVTPNNFTWQIKFLKSEFASHIYCTYDFYCD